ncbi:MAG: hypothetical protein FP816_19765 [Desulfobacteraceae bacterium]|nr:hypothetical protein [Desulfobacteraceae bacterium]
MDIKTDIGSALDFAKSLVDRWFPPSANPEDKLKASIELEKMLNDRENVLVQAKASIMTAEMNQEDKYTKRGRPTIIYAGLAFIGLVHVVFPIIAWAALVIKGGTITLPAIALPDEFWMAWGGAVSIYILGRSSEKAGGEVGGLMGKMYGMISGAKK